jgi:acyl carrier protein
MTDDDLRAVFIAALARVTAHDAESIRDDTPLDRLGFDSLMFTALLLEVEEALGVEFSPEALARIEDADLARVQLVGELARVLSSATAGPA